MTVLYDYFLLLRTVPPHNRVNILLFFSAWNSSSMRIYRKPFDSSIACGKAKEIVFHTCSITEGSVLRVFRNLKKETVHLTINGIEQKVSVGGCCPNFCYGYLRLSANGAGSEIRVTLIPRENEGT